MIHKKGGQWPAFLFYGRALYDAHKFVRRTFARRSSRVARPRKSQSSSGGGHQLSPGHASYVLDRLIADRRISATDVHRYAGDIDREISELERKLQQLRGASAAGAAPALRRRGRPPGRPAGSTTAVATQPPAGGARRRRRRGSAITAEQSASRQLQGKYLSLIRQIPASRRAQYSRIAKERGREAAIRELQAAVNK